MVRSRLKREIFYINNVFKDEKISNYEKKYNEIKSDLLGLLIQSSINVINSLGLFNWSSIL